MSDVAVMTALIEQTAVGKDAYDRLWRCTPNSAKKAAEALYAAGFRMASTPVDDQQNERLAAIEKALHRIEGYMVIQ